MINNRTGFDQKIESRFSSTKCAKGYPAIDKLIHYNVTALIKLTKT